jgi:uncharacterized protein YndB with AHSA1/START domain
MSNTNVSTAGREIIISRLLNAPPELVFETWTDPKHLIHWYGPNGFTLTSKEMEVKKGGSWKFTMHGPDGRDYPNRVIFIDVVKPEKLVYRHSGDDDTEDVDFHTTVTFEKQGNQTKLTMHSVFSSAEELERVNREYGAIEGGKQTVNRLAEYLLSINNS